jgi:tRNA A37 threonylcarbamoyladenosine biosynthesis protein TsaE
LGLDEMFESDAVTVIEWAERLNVLPQGSIQVRIEYISDSERNITVADAI